MCSSSCKGMAHQIPVSPLLFLAHGLGDPQASPEDTTKTPGQCHLHPLSQAVATKEEMSLFPCPRPTHQHASEAPAQADVELLPVAQEDEVALGQLMRGTQHCLVGWQGTQLRAQPGGGLRTWPASLWATLCLEP